MNPPPQAEVLRIVLGLARGSARRRIAGAVTVDLLLGAVVLVAIAAVVAGVTLRGDLAALVLVTTLAIAAIARLVYAVVDARKRMGTDHRVARSIAAHAAPMGTPKTAARAREQRLLRHELLGATELLDTLGKESPGPHAGSPRLAAHYVVDVAQRLCADDIDMRRALPGPRWRPRAIALIVVLLGLALATTGPLADGLGLLIARADATPETPPEPVWSSLRLRLTYPQHTGRPERDVPNPSGALRVPAGTVVHLEMDTQRRAGAAHVVVTYDSEELSTAPPPEMIPLESQDDTGMRWAGPFTVRATGTWTVVLLDDEDDDL
ncbi:MAG: hypothetical protein K0V04_06395, partial [Deltaproteobacteria bacterium]|nr:hypothetical protein [Deltaproteobacteria bacterium]